MSEVEISERLMKVFEKASKNCNCSYDPMHFKSVLHEFVGVRLAIHHSRKRGRIPYDLMNRATMLRHRLEMLAPCKDCIEKFNPTSRSSGKIWNPTRKRAYKEALR